MTTLLSRLSRIAAAPEVLGAIQDDDCNLAIWQRVPFANFVPLVEGDPQDLRFTCDVATLPALLAKGLAHGGYGGDAALHRALIDDAAQLARLFCAAMGLVTFELRLEVVRTDSCRKFHADYVSARLITTYVGEGTDWLDDADAQRVAAGAAPLRLNRLSPFDVGLFKGKLATDRPAIHRSPPIAETVGDARLLLVLNPDTRRPVDGAQSPLPPHHHLS
ncbi:MAG: DUF1826 domain-containing protein [Sphingomonadales bacterium]|nr:MAG: DUF1826 domain-containing protein [Sphingomonadales bacterium]